ncbi:MAG: hypothetical protein DRI86_06375 [Bacteroidetes bacterium]|nr:MAG: hypothetical protein DRI86_06375 [Bacteroidota bacterium]
MQAITSSDSIITINLFINDSYSFIEFNSICSGDSIFWQGNYYSNNGQFYANYSTNSGCDSNYTLNLTVNPLPQIVNIITNPSNGVLLNSNLGEIIITNSIVSDSYWVSKDSIAYSGIFTGNGTSLSLGNIYTPDTFEVWSKNNNTACFIKQSEIVFIEQFNISTSTNPTNAGSVTGVGHL